MRNWKHKVQQAIDTITLLQMEIEELKEKTTHCRRKFKMPSISAKKLER
ncbi:cell division protein ZapB [Escherichia coli]